MTQESTVTVQVCQEPPVLDVVPQIIIVGEVYDPLAGVTATDCDGTAIPMDASNVVLNTVDTSVIGEYQVGYEVTSPTNGKVTTGQFTVTVGAACLEEPTLVITQQIVTVGDVFDPLAGVTAFDCNGNVIPLDASNVISNAVDTTTPGQYPVMYEVTSPINGLVMTQESTVTVQVCQEPPTIIAESKIIAVGSIFDPLLDVEAFDCTKTEPVSLFRRIARFAAPALLAEPTPIPLDMSNVIFINVDTTTMGEYIVVYQVTSPTNGLVSTLEITVTVICQEPPIMEIEEQVVAVGSVFDPMVGVEAFDCDGSVMEVGLENVVSNNVNTALAGEYTVVYAVASQSSGLVTTVQTRVVVIEMCTEPPTIIVEPQIVVVGSAFDPMVGVTALNCDGTIMPIDENIVIFNDVNTSEVGTYRVVYQVTSPLNGVVTTQETIVVVTASTPRKQSISDIITSVALEQAALSHILNAEGEKIQKAVALDLSINEMLLVNKSVNSMVKSITNLEMILQMKLETFDCNLCDKD